MYNTNSTRRDPSERNRHYSGEPTSPTSPTSVNWPKGIEHVFISGDVPATINDSPISAPNNNQNRPITASYENPAMAMEKSTEYLAEPEDNVTFYEPKEWDKSKDVMVEDIKDASGGERETWGHKAEFILATVGLAVGLGNVWRFPYLCQKNGGGAFLIPYFIFMFIEGLPLFFLELAIGQRMRKSAVNVWNDIHPALFGVGIGCVCVSIMLCLYYVVVIAWCVFYLFMSFTSDLPWQRQHCPEYGPWMKAKSNASYWSGILEQTNETWSNYTYINSTATAAAQRYTNFESCCVVDPAQWYFYERALQISTDIDDSGIGLNWKLAGCLLCAWVITYACVVKGIKSSGKAVYFTATFPYIVLLIFFFRGVTLEGAGIGIETFFKPDFSRLKEAGIWKDAATQMFFTLSLGFGALISFSSYMPIHNQVMRDGYMVVFINCGTSIFAGIVVFSILGYRELKTGIPASSVGSGPGLAFMTFSEAMLLMDVSPLWAILFFMMLILLGIDSEFGTLEGAIAPLLELNIFPKMRKEYFTLAVSVILFFFGLGIVSGPGFYIFQIWDDYSATIPLLIIALFECIGVAWIYGNERFADDIEFMTGKRPWIGWMICWKYISPIALLIVTVSVVIDNITGTPSYSAYVGCLQNPYSSKYPGDKTWKTKLEYPAWGRFLVTFVVLFSVLPIAIWLIRGFPKDFKTKFYNMFCTGTNNYLPDPKRDNAGATSAKI